MRVALAREHLFLAGHTVQFFCCTACQSKASDAWRTSGWGIMGESLFRLAIAI